MSHRPHTPTLLALLAAALLAAPSLATAKPDLDEQVESLHKEIVSLRVIHGLELSQEQIDEIVPLVEEGIGLVDDLKAVDAENKKDSLVVLRQVRDDMAAEGEVSEATEAAVRDHHKTCEKAMRPVIFELKDLAEEVMLVLDEEQREKVHQAVNRPPWEKRGERRARAEQEERHRHDLPPRAQEEIRHHNMRKLFGLVFSDEFLTTLQEA